MIAKVRGDYFLLPFYKAVVPVPAAAASGNVLEIEISGAIPVPQIRNSGVQAHQFVFKH